ncbi:MAG: VWA domain-containing protein [Chloroflexi bacterium AL-W]|nr:VWA domain-containing protein [Chloroflexi bacterium AL-N1]NOK70641.1 VWA domain-containing protein [Chloroflexi bacterium AL-N10]NOK78460.1 VWA domain-containing protein [Chloroflexi bacterium AL-N5]NOK85544.1 VWA domain-containing protein [Chloroflexi bacterium AL-W]NOK92458.1 VWA domain-containing protein [Chloroflexi bacterium AL-N15]
MTFEWPYLLIGLIIIPILCLFYVQAQRKRRTYAVRFTNLALLKDVAGRGPGIRRHIPPLLYLLGLVALLTSLARPMAVIAVPRDQTTVMLAMDVSGSMIADDLLPDRMTAAQQAARAFIDALPERAQVGIVSFSASASVSAPPTHDRTLVLRAVDNMFPSGGTAIGDGIALSLNQLSQIPVNEDGTRPPGIVIVLSDGQSTHGIAPEAAAMLATEEEVPVYTIGIGQRGAVPIINGRPVALDEITLERVAEATGGQYFYAAESGELERIYTDLGTQISWVEERTEITSLVSALAMFFFLIGGMLSLRWFQQFP